MRLIDADRLIKNLNFLYKSKVPIDFNAKQVLTTIMEQPTAYDIDKVVEELKDLGAKYCTNVSCNYECKDSSHGILMQKAIEIVKQQMESEDKNV